MWATIQGMASFTKADLGANPLVPGSLGLKMQLCEERVIEALLFLLQVSSRGPNWLWGEV